MGQIVRPLFCSSEGGLERYPPLNATCSVILTLLVFSGCYSIFILCHTDEICEVTSWWHWCVNYRLSLKQCAHILVFTYA